MANLSAAEIAQAARGAGFPADQIQTAVAVALAESAGNPNAVNRNTNGSTDYGLWQINTVHGSLLSQGNKFDPNDNAKMAHTVWAQAGGKWTPWATYNSQRYRTFIPQATLAAASGAQSNGSAPTTTNPSGQTVGTVTGPDTASGSAPATSASPLTTIADLLSQLASGGIWLRLGSIVFGAALILFSLNKLTGFGGAAVKLGKTAVKAAGTAAIVA